MSNKTDEELILEFLKNGGVIKEYISPDWMEFSKFGGRTRSHLDFSDNSSSSLLEIKHPYEGKRFLLDSESVLCTRYFCYQKKNKIGYFKFSNGRTLSDSSLSRKLHNGSACKCEA